METDWITKEASEFCSSVRDGTHNSPKEVSEGGKNLVTSRHIKGGMLDFTKSYKISTQDFNEINLRSKVNQWDVLFSMIGTIGEVLLVKDEEPDYAIKNVGLFKCKSKLDGKWLYYFLNSPLAKREILSLSRGTTQQYIPLGSLRKLSIRYPNCDLEKKKIIRFLSNIDEKIEINKKNNETLEDIAKAIFKSWFIDFDPVKAKAEGCSTGLPDEISDLFPDSFEDSELGQIPKGWQISKSTDFCDSVRDGTHNSPKQVSFGGYPLVTSKHIKNKILDLSSAYNISDKDYHEVNKRSLVEKGDVLISMIGTLGEILYVDQNPKFAIKNIGLFKSKSEQFGQWWFLYLQSKIVKNFLRINAQGSTQQYLSLSTLRSIPVIFPDKVLLERFSEYTKEFFYKKLKTNKEIQLLEKIRNNLLPKLISGDLRIPDAEKMIEEFGI